MPTYKITYEVSPTSPLIPLRGAKVCVYVDSVSPSGALFRANRLFAEEVWVDDDGSGLSVRAVQLVEDKACMEEFPR